MLAVTQGIQALASALRLSGIHSWAQSPHARVITVTLYIMCDRV